MDESHPLLQATSPPIAFLSCVGPLLLGTVNRYDHAIDRIRQLPGERA